MRKNKTNFQQGFTLIEVLVYGVVFSLFLLLVTQIFITIKLTSANSLTMINLQQNYIRIFSDLNQTVRGASEVDFPLPGQTGGGLSLNNGQVVYQVEEGVLEKVIGGLPVALSDPGISVNAVNFENLGEVDQKASVKIQMTFESNYLLEGGRILSEDFQTAINLR